MKRVYGMLTICLCFLFGGCFATNVDVRAKEVYAREFKGLQIQIARTDLSGVFVDMESKAHDDVEILWEKSTLGGSAIVRHDHILNDSPDRAVTLLKELERRSFVLHRKADFYYLDPVLYQNGGLRIKPLQYPVELVLMTRHRGKEEAVSIFVDNNYDSMEKINEDRYQEDAYKMKAKEDAKKEDKDYIERYVDGGFWHGRTKEDSIPKRRAPFKDEDPIKDTLIIEHRTENK